MASKFKIVDMCLNLIKKRQINEKNKIEENCQMDTQ